MAFELSNEQRRYLGLDPVEPHWEKASLKSGPYREEGIVYFDGDVIKRRIISTDTLYNETQYNEPTRDRIVLLPKTAKGKEKALSGSVLSSRHPLGTYCEIDNYVRVFIGNHTTQTTFYDTSWEKPQKKDAPTQDINNTVVDFISSSSALHLKDIEEFKNAKRKNCKFKHGDYFAFKISRTQYGFGRILVDIARLRKKIELPKGHGLGFVMTLPVLVKLYAYISDKKDVDINVLQKQPSLPSDYMMDNLLLYGQFEIIGHKKLTPDDLDFPISYGRHIDAQQRSAFLQWGLIHKEVPSTSFSEYFYADNPFNAESQHKIINPFGFYGVGIYPRYAELYEIQKSISNGGFDFAMYKDYRTHFDLRNPANKNIREELMKLFGLDASKSYDENCSLTATLTSEDVIGL
ncbi:hypothetical protein D0C36_10115 [Mucilaginibacter conchicola]|uniref:Uncharacterized protein n=1 Tax=Mucilaginibacter conchicola TaxID=2303333 RepID=A0A372NT02_9SPHI|nr:immunity 26/phosphotriesterase HocA family protein [Mucilaginibacter conchicola]RFZ91799.1 hypothetical protein D0C36_10115 [Mucilaginibacter conchicola]